MSLLKQALGVVLFVPKRQMCTHMLVQASKTSTPVIFEAFQSPVNMKYPWLHGVKYWAKIDMLFLFGVSMVIEVLRYIVLADPFEPNSFL